VAAQVQGAQGGVRLLGAESHQRLPVDSYSWREWWVVEDLWAFNSERSRRVAAMPMPVISAMARTM